MGYGIRFRLWGEYACFTRPEMKVERVSYDVITPSAAKGALECIYWKPSIKWVIDKITVMNHIEFGNIKINEVKKKANMPKKDLAKMTEKDYFLYTNENDNRAQRGIMYIKNPDYIIDAHFEPTGIGDDTNDFDKHYAIVSRRLKLGQCFKQPCLGLRDFTANFKFIEDNEFFKSPLEGEIDLGFMLYDMKFKDKESKKEKESNNPLGKKEWSDIKNSLSNDASAVFYRAIMKDGVIDVTKCFQQGVAE